MPLSPARRLPLLASVLLAGAALAGCANGPDGLAGAAAPLVFRDDWAEAALPYGEDHDHYDSKQHQGLSTPNFELLGWDPLISDYYGRSAGGYLCGDSVDNGERRLAAVHGYQSDVAFQLVDVTDGAHPQPLGEFVLPRAAARDVALTPDGHHVAIAIATPDEGPMPVLGIGAPASSTPVQASWRSACSPDAVPVGPEQEVPFPPGVMLVNIDDMAAPRIVGYYELPVLGAHSIYAGELGGRTIVIAAVVNLVAAVSNFWFFEVTEAGLTFLTLYQEPATSGGAPLVNGHNDAVVQEHPITGQPLVYLANWHQGMSILDFTDPLMPTRIGGWSDSQGTANADLVQDGHGNVHEAIPIPGTWGDRHYTIVGQEILDRPLGTPSGLVHVLDTTDPANPTPVATWTLPVEVEWEAEAIWSTHYVSVDGSTLFVAHYHAGVWAVDLSGFLDGTVDAEDRFPPAVGVFLPTNQTPAPPPRSAYDWTPTVMDANAIGNNELVVWDSQSGVYVVKWDPTQPAPARVYDGLH